MSVRIKYQTRKKKKAKITTLITIYINGNAYVEHIVVRFFAKEVFNTK